MATRLTNKRPACWLAVFLAFVLMASACGGGDDGREAQPSQSVETTETSEVAETTETAAPAEPADSAGAPDDAPAATGTEPADTQEQEPLLAPVDTTTTTAPPSEGAGPAEPEPQFGGTLRVGVEAEGDSLNPTVGSFAVSAYVMTYPIFEPVAYWDKSGNWIPYLAESFTPINGGESWQMKLRPGVRFHDGTELDADDVIATHEAQLRDLEIQLAVRPSIPRPARSRRSTISPCSTTRCGPASSSPSSSPASSE